MKRKQKGKFHIGSPNWIEEQKALEEKKYSHRKSRIGEEEESVCNNQGDLI